MNSIAGMSKLSVKMACIYSCLSFFTSMQFQIRFTIRNRILTPTRFILFYVLVDIITIFCNILLNPLAPRVSKDLEHISEATRSIRQTRSPNDLIRESPLTKGLDRVISEITRLVECAISKERQIHVS